MVVQTDALIEKLAEKAIETIPTSDFFTSFVLRKKMNASEMIEELTGEIIIEQENVFYFWNMVGAALAYVKPDTLIY